MPKVQDRDLIGINTSLLAVPVGPVPVGLVPVPMVPAGKALVLVVPMVPAGKALVLAVLVTAKALALAGKAPVVPMVPAGKVPALGGLVPAVPALVLVDKALLPVGLVLVMALAVPVGLVLVMALAVPVRFRTVPRRTVAPGVDPLAESVPARVMVLVPARVMALVPARVMALVLVMGLLQANPGSAAIEASGLARRGTRKRGRKRLTAGPSGCSSSCSTSPRQSLKVRSSSTFIDVSAGRGETGAP